MKEAITKAVEAQEQIERILAGYLSQNRMPVMSGDMRDRLTPRGRRECTQAARDVIAALTALQEQPARVVTHRHKNRGSEYMLVGYGRMQCDWWEHVGGNRYPADMREVAVYRCVDDNSLWVRPREEFEDGRFEVISALTTLQEQPASPGPYEARVCKGMPADCCDYGVISHATGKEVCRVWTEADARMIASALQPSPGDIARAAIAKTK